MALATAIATTQGCLARHDPGYGHEYDLNPAALTVPPSAGLAGLSYRRTADDL